MCRMQLYPLHCSALCCVDGGSDDGDDDDNDDDDKQLVSEPKATTPCIQIAMQCTLFVGKAASHENQATFIN